MYQFDLPDRFDKRYKVNISLKSKDAKTLKKLLRSKGKMFHYISHVA